jgi:UDP-N-acetyl-D-mannosaminuronate dehydrogenase
LNLPEARIHKIVSGSSKVRGFKLIKLRLSVVGLGKLGVPMLAVFAGKGFDIVGVDLNPASV